MNKTQRRIAAARALKAFPGDISLRQELLRECKLPKGGYRLPAGCDPSIALGDALGRAGVVDSWLLHVDDTEPTQWWEVVRYGSNAANQHCTPKMVVGMVQAFTAAHAAVIMENTPGITTYNNQHLSCRKVSAWKAEGWLEEQAQYC